MTLPTVTHPPPAPRPCDQAVQNHARDSFYYYRLVAYLLGDTPPRPLVSRGMHPFTRRLLAHAYRTTAQRARAARPPRYDTDSDDDSISSSISCSSDKGSDSDDSEDDVGGVGNECSKLNSGKRDSDVSSKRE